VLLVSLIKGKIIWPFIPLSTFSSIIILIDLTGTEIIRNIHFICRTIQKHIHKAVYAKTGSWKKMKYWSGKIKSTSLTTNN
jgi:hypothetical protein